MPAKRKATPPAQASSPGQEEQHGGGGGGYNNNYNKRLKSAPNAEEEGGNSEGDGDIIQRAFYPPEISTARCQQYIDGTLPLPHSLLIAALADTQAQRDGIAVGDAVVHWFKRDLRTFDNRALARASLKAREAGVPLVCMFLISPQDYQAHLTSPARVDFELRSLAILHADLAEQNIPLYVTTVDRRRDIPAHILRKCAEWRAKHIFCNIEYEVDELRRETSLVSQCLERDIAFTAVHDDVLVPPATLVSGSGKPYSVYSPWYRAWVRHLHAHPHLLDPSPCPTANSPSTKDDPRFHSYFTSPIPPAPSSKRLTTEESLRFASLWPAGEHEARARLGRFIKEKVSEYASMRNFPAENSTSLLSPHLAAGTLAARTAVRAARDANSTTRLDGGQEGIRGWISEIAWRDFYKHILVQWPYVCMSKPFKPEYASVRWGKDTEDEDGDGDEEAFARWKEGRTGFPFVDAAMRQLRHMGWMHNRCRMVVASFLSKDLLLDWRRGEAYFMRRLVDGDFASNNGGWGFGASVGADPQPWFRVFNPVLQGERFDAEGEFIRKWVPELRGVKGNKVHDPYGRGAGKEAEEAGYPRMMVVHGEARERALARYKEGLRRGKQV
ncbi:MAG: hypothetical protein FE78DRAFT_89434 [Acidomyces sp. 'richmondensis']|nr:MAG: hypothetical protein FE78DRAFT_89434 [Acidomyces sp. 'richmondensis']